MGSVEAIFAIFVLCISVFGATVWAWRKIFCACADSEVSRTKSKKRKKRSAGRSNQKNRVSKDPGTTSREVHDGALHALPEVGESITAEEGEELLEGEAIHPKERTEVEESEEPSKIEPFKHKKAVVVDVSKLLERQAKEEWTSVNRPARHFTANSSSHISSSEAAASQSRSEAKRRQRERKKSERELVREWERTHL
jgi:hypothetical protein